MDRMAKAGVAAAAAVASGHPLDMLALSGNGSNSRSDLNHEYSGDESLPPRKRKVSHEEMSASEHSGGGGNGKVVAMAAAMVGAATVTAANGLHESVGGAGEATPTAVN